MSETAPTDASVKPAPPVDPAPPSDEELAFEDTHVQLDPEMLGLKVGTPELVDDVLPEPLAEPEPEADAAAEEPHVGHDEL